LAFTFIFSPVDYKLSQRAEQTIANNEATGDRR